MGDEGLEQAGEASGNSSEDHKGGAADAPHGNACDLDLAELYFDAHYDGFRTSHDLGIFRVATKSLVTSATIDAGVSAPIEGAHVAGGGFRYVSALSVVLTPGTNHIIAATPVGYIDQTASFQPIDNNHQLETAPDILFIQGRYSFFEPPGLEFPEDEFPNVKFGPSFQFEVIPEPSTYALGAFALLTLLAFRRCR